MSTEQQYAPQSDRIVVWTNRQCQTPETMGIRHVFQNLDVQLPLLLWGPVLAVVRLDKVLRHVVGSKGFGKALRRCLVFAALEHARLVEIDHGLAEIGTAQLGGLRGAGGRLDGDRRLDFLHDCGGRSSGRFLEMGLGKFHSFLPIGRNEYGCGEHG